MDKRWNRLVHQLQTQKELCRFLYWVIYLADIFDKFQCWVVEWQVGSRQDGEHLRGLCHTPGTRHLLLNFLSDGENVLC